MTHLTILTAARDEMLETPAAPARSIVPAGGTVYQAAKRALDAAVAAGMLLVLSPLMLLVAAAVKLTSRGPVLFRQVRAGLNELPFTMFKFRTMRLGAEDDRELLAHLNEQSGPVFKIPEDPRLTPVGRFLRRSSLDELPQLFNVLRGEMSLVGPRPLWMVEARQARGAARLRTLVKPGLTCLWQISGRSELDYDTWVEMDLFYIRRRSFLLDLLITIQTVPAVLSGRGAY
ncbi:MAG: putative sugar transferase EpsL [Planctomycetes bacterium ADurb.Bin126]|nr:MAG: putative sugar transferase EpsL [Planctomycetes bacterium ADurb.Bin126]HOD79994.1 sugar transferase [Phycisphaerae bacterium]HQL74050.1 sugar transferase [Phycisphaerae bacterium]